MSLQDRAPDPADPVVPSRARSWRISRSRRAGSRRTGSRPSRWRGTAVLVALSVVLTVVVKSLFLQAFYIPSASMEPGLVKDDRILVEKVSAWGDAGPARGDVVVFEDPGDWLQDPAPVGAVAGLLSKVGLHPSGGHLVKRVVGVAGDVVTCCDERGRISVNGEPLDEADYTRLDGAACYGPMTRTCDWTAGPVPEDHVFVMGDHRSNSGDSTVHLCDPGDPDCAEGGAFVPVDLVVGRVVALVWPAGRAGLLHRPAGFDAVPAPVTREEAP